VPKNAVLQGPDHIDGHAVLQTFFTDDDPFLEEFVGNQVLGPAHDAGDGAADIGAGYNGTLRGSQVYPYVEDIVVYNGFLRHRKMLPEIREYALNS